MFQGMIVVFALLLGQVCFAQTPVTQIAIGEGKAVIRNITPEQARQQAYQQARKSGIQNALGLTVQGESFVKNAAFAGEFIRGTVYGHIVNEDTLLDTTVVEKFHGEMFLVYQVKLKLDVIPERGEPDPSFRISLDLNKNTFAAGEEMWLTLRTTQNCYVIVLCVDANDDIYVLFPNNYQPDNLLITNETVEIPSEKDREMGLRYRVAPLPGHPEDTELIIAIAVKKPVAFLEEIEEIDGVKKFKNDKFALTELAKWLSTIPVSERAQASQVYIVRAN